jgi:predicted Fe-Mo cluster-binding NifX family protein
MLIAVMSDKPDLTGTVPDRFETSPALLFIETDGDALKRAVSGKAAADYAKLIAESFCEAVVCGCHIGKDCFEPIADAGVTRYDGAGLSVLVAARAAERGTLPLIPDYEGGTGCGSGTGECHEHD